MTNVLKFHHYYLSIKVYVDTQIIPNTGITLLILAQFFNSIMVTTCKLLETDKSLDIKFNPFQILFYRMIITYICCILYMYITQSVEDSPFGPKSVRHLLFTRGFLGFFGVFWLYFSLQYLSLSDAVAITFLVPMITGIMAWIMLHERYSIIQGICAVISFTGVLLIAKPLFIFGEKAIWTLWTTRWKVP
jgi:drug/metabolite transporter (DMT)-like permease